MVEEDLGKKLANTTFSQLSDKYDNFIFDCDGVLWRANKEIPGSLNAIKTMQDKGKNVFFMTNNSQKTREYYVNEHIPSFGTDLKVQKNNFYTSGSLALLHIEQKNLVKDK